MSYIREDDGFTLVELLLVVAATGLFAAAAFPVTQTAFRRVEERAVLDAVSDAVRMAQAYAMDGVEDAAWGASVVPGQATVFLGDSYVSRDPAYDITFPIPSAYEISGASEFPFERRTGETTPGTLVLVRPDGVALVVDINQFGVVEYE